MLALSATTALWLLAIALPVSLVVIVTDLRTMKIPNTAVMALTIGFAVIGLLVMPIEQFLWQWANLVVVLIVGICLYAVGAVGAGDAKYAAAAAPYVLVADLSSVLIIFVVCLLAAFTVHRIVKHTRLRNLAPDWKSWDVGGRFPMGMPLGMTLISYLVIAALSGT